MKTSASKNTSTSLANGIHVEKFHLDCKLFRESDIRSLMLRLEASVAQRVHKRWFFQQHDIPRDPGNQKFLTIKNFLVQPVLGLVFFGKPFLVIVLKSQAQMFGFDAGLHVLRSFPAFGWIA